jgi:hypothetical protein
MKIDIDGLKAAYRDYVLSQSPTSREGCPSPEHLIRMIRGEGTEAEKTGTVDHISHCGECAREFDFLLGTVRSEAAMIKALDGAERPEPADRRRPFYFRFSWGLASALLGVAAAGFLFWKLALSPSSDTYRAGAVSKIELILPGQARAELANLVFVWKPVRGAEYYVVEVFDEALAPLWKSEEVLQDRAVPPAGLKDKLAPGRTYFWQVTAHFPERETLVSPVQAFTLKD